MKNVILGLFIVGAIFVLVSFQKLFENNTAGQIQVKQSAITGQLSVQSNPGIYYQGWGAITSYLISDTYDFNAAADKINVRFNDASTADISGSIKFRIPSNEQDILKIHKDFRSYASLESTLIRQVVSSALKQSSTFFRAEDVYSTRRADFIDMVNDQIKEGIYATAYTEELKKDELDPTKNVLVKKVSIRTNADGQPIINEVSGFKTYNIELVQLVINDIDFDVKTDGLIAQKKDAEQQRVVAVANAERAKQDAITAQEQGKANVAIAEASALVEAKKATVEAEKNRMVAQQQALQAIEEKKAVIARGEAEAEATKLKVDAGLSPLDRANIDRDTAIGVAEKLATIKFPNMLVIGGSGNGSSAMNPFDAVGLKSFIDISKSMSQTEAAK